MKLSALLSQVPQLDSINFQDIEITHISHDSRQVTENSIFIAIRGERFDGRKFINACAAPVVIVDQFPEEQTDKTVILVSNLRRTMAKLSHELYGKPSSDLQMIGITGTNGKTTASWMLSHILQDLGQSVGVIGTLGHQLNGKKLPTQDGHTTPESPQVHQMLRHFRDNGCQSCIMEVSSIGIPMQRVHSIEFDVLAFTNFTQDHLDFHGTMEEYFAAKKEFITDYPSEKSTIILNQDQEKIALIPVQRGRRESFGWHDDATWKLCSQELHLEGIHFSFQLQSIEYSVSLPVVGAHNIENALVAISSAHALGFPLDGIIKALESLPQAPGRLEKISSEEGWHAFVDYAHTPDALEKSLQTLRDLNPNKLVVVFGCGGDRDRQKRPMMGAIAEKLAALVFVTSDNPRSEDPQEIIAEILKGCTRPVHSITDRRQAIQEAISHLETGDILLVAGKGHETYQIIGTKTDHFDDREVIREQL